MYFSRPLWADLRITLAMFICHFHIWGLADFDSHLRFVARKDSKMWASQV